jgi:hypothetical protein
MQAAPGNSTVAAISSHLEHWDARELAMLHMHFRMAAQNARDTPLDPAVLQTANPLCHFALLGEQTYNAVLYMGDGNEALIAHCDRVATVNLPRVPFIADAIASEK